MLNNYTADINHIPENTLPTENTFDYTFKPVNTALIWADYIPKNTTESSVYLYPALNYSIIRYAIFCSQNIFCDSKFYKAFDKISDIEKYDLIYDKIKSMVKFTYFNKYEIIFAGDDFLISINTANTKISTTKKEYLNFFDDIFQKINIL